MALIPLWRKDGTAAGHAIVDDADAAVLGCHRWSLNTKGYAVRYESGRVVMMHRCVLSLTASDELETDHINRDKLDNRRSNLRAVTHAENLQNKGSYRGSTSRYRGVYWDAARQKWNAQITVGGRRTKLGRFADEATAGAVAAEARRASMPFSAEAAG